MKRTVITFYAIVQNIFVTTNGCHKLVKSSTGIFQVVPGKRFGKSVSQQLWGAAGDWEITGTLMLTLVCISAGLPAGTAGQHQVGEPGGGDGQVPAAAVLLHQLRDHLPRHGTLQHTHRVHLSKSLPFLSWSSVASGANFLVYSSSATSGPRIRVMDPDPEISHMFQQSV